MRSYIIVTGVIVFFMLSCKKKHTDLPATTTTTGNGSKYEIVYRGVPEIGVLLNFNATAPDSGTFLWTFGDGGSSTLHHPQYSYNDSGNHSVSLVINGDTAHKINKTINIAGLNYPFYYTGNPCKGSAIRLLFPAPIASGTTFLWDFGDGSPVTTDSTPSHIYTATGTYLVKLLIDSVTTKPYFKSIKIFNDPVYTHLIGGTRIWKRTEKVTYILGPITTILPDSSFGINILDAVTISLGNSKFVYIPDSSGTDKLTYTLSDASSSYYTSFTISYYHAADSISMRFYQTHWAGMVGKPPVTYYDDLWHTQ